MNVSLFSTDQFWSDEKPWAADGTDLSGVIHIDGCVVFRTSGSSGAAKWIVLEKTALLQSATCVNALLNVDSQSVWGLALPLGHVGGFGVLARGFDKNCKVQVFNNKWNACIFTNFLEYARVTHLSLVPTQVHDLVAAECHAPRQLRAVVVGGGRLLADLGQAARDLGWPVLASYGMTESCSQVATMSIDSINRPFESENLELLPIWSARISSHGLLELKGSVLFKGILEETAGGLLFRAREGEWYETRDRGEIEGKSFKPLGRADSVVKILGELVDIEALERRFLGYAGGRLVAEKFAIVALRDARREHCLIAVCEGDVPGMDEIFTQYQLEANGLERLSGIMTLDHFPRSELGKQKKLELAACIEASGGSWRVLPG